MKNLLKILCVSFFTLTLATNDALAYGWTFKNLDETEAVMLKKYNHSNHSYTLIASVDQNSTYTCPDNDTYKYDGGSIIVCVFINNVKKGQFTPDSSTDSEATWDGTNVNCTNCFPF